MTADAFLLYLDALPVRTSIPLFLISLIQVFVRTSNPDIAQSVPDCIEDEFLVALYLSGKLPEGLNTGVGNPPSPLVKEETGLFRVMYLLKPAPLVLCKILRSLADGER